MNIGRAIKLCRTQRGLSQAELAAKSSISVSYISLLEKSKRDPNLSTLGKIARGLAVPLSILSFLAADADEIDSLGVELVDKLSSMSLKLISEIDA